ncbi:MAG: ABC transporter permease, partial [Bacteroidota bacterium]
MNTPLYIAKHIIFNKENKKNISRPIIAISVASIALSLAAMIISIAVVTGFKSEITRKVIGFGSHIQIINYDSNQSYETINPVKKQQPFYPGITEYPDIAHIQIYATKPGIIKSEDNIQGIVLKGIGTDFNWDFFKENLVEGNILSITDTSITNKVLISKYISSLLQLNMGDKFATYFIQQPPRMRVFEVGGVYETTLESFDKIYILSDIGHIQALNDWNDNEASGFEILLTGFQDIDFNTWLVRREVQAFMEPESEFLRVRNIKEQYPQIFDWLELQDLNVIIILMLVLAVAIINMISALIILILERTNFIGILKALGTTNRTIKTIFLYQAGFLILKGLFWGNIIGIAICL